MSDTPSKPTVPAPSLPPAVLGRGTIVTSIVVQITYLAVFAAVGYLAYKGVTGAAEFLYGLGGVAATNATTVVQFWCGSSVGSARKTEMLHNPYYRPDPPPRPPIPPATGPSA